MKKLLILLIVFFISCKPQSKYRIIISRGDSHDTYYTNSYKMDSVTNCITFKKAKNMCGPGEGVTICGSYQIEEQKGYNPLEAPKINK